MPLDLIEDIGGGPGGQNLRTFLQVAHNDDGTLRNAGATTLAAILAAGNDGAGSKIANIGTPTNPADAVTKAYADALVVTAQTLAAVLASGNSAGGVPITSLGAPSGANDAATKAYVDAQDAATSNLNSVLTAGNDGGAHKIANIGAPTVSTDAATKAYVDALTRTLSQILAAGADAGAFRITNLGAPTVSTDAATKAYVDSKSPGSLATVLAVGLDAAGLVMTNLGTPVNPSDAATKAYVDVLTPNSQSSAAYTLALTDVGKLVIMTNAAANTLTIPPNSSVAFPLWTEIHLRQGTTAGTLTVVAGGGVTIVPDPGSSTNALTGPSARATLLKIGTDTWALNGQVT